MKKSTILGLALATAFGASADIVSVRPASPEAVARYQAQAVSRAADDDEEDDDYKYPDFSGDTYKSVGTGYYTDDVVSAFFGDPVASWDVEVEQSVEHPGVYRIKNVYENNPYYKFKACEHHSPYFYINTTDPEGVYTHFYYTGIFAEWTIKDTETGEVTTSLEEVKIGSIAGDRYYRNGPASAPIVGKENNEVGSFVFGNITFPLNSLMSASTDPAQNIEWEDALQYNTFNKRTTKLLILGDAPDVTASANIGQLRELEDGSRVIPVSATFSKDITEARLTMLKGQFSDEEAQEVLAKLAAGEIEHKSLTFADVQLHKNVFEYPFEGTSIYTAFAVTFIDGKVASKVSHERELVYDNNWIQVNGYAKYTDCFLSDNEPMYNPVSQWTGFMEPKEREVIVEQNVTNPGLIRLVNPYSGQAPTYYEYSRPDLGWSETAYDEDHYYYMNFDLSRPDKVTLATTENGIGLTNVADALMGYVKVSSRAYRYQTSGGPLFDEYEGEYRWSIWNDDDVTKEKLWGTYDADTRTLTFEPEALCVNFETAPANWYYASCKNTFKLVLPEGIDGVEEIVADNVAEDSDAPVQYFNLQGVPVANPVAGQIYIKVQGNKASKVVLR